VLCLSENISEKVEALRTFLYARVYEGKETKREFKKAEKILTDLYDYYMDHPEEVFNDIPAVEGESAERRVCDLLAGMTDRFAIQTFESIFMPTQWEIY
jgi:dGTPase